MPARENQATAAHAPGIGRDGVAARQPLLKFRDFDR